MNYLLDTNIISAVSPTKKERPHALVRWLDEASDGVYLSVVTAAEIRDGIAKTAREGASLKAKNLNAWWDAVEHLYGARILAFDLRAAKIAGKMMDLQEAPETSGIRRHRDCGDRASARSDYPLWKPEAFPADLRLGP